MRTRRVVGNLSVSSMKFSFERDPELDWEEEVCAGGGGGAASGDSMSALTAVSFSLKGYGPGRLV